MGIVGLMKTAPPVTIPFKEEGRTVMVLGSVGNTDAVRFGGTQYAKAILNDMWGLPPALDMDEEKRVQAAIREIVNRELVQSAHDVSDGGIAVALAECCMAGIGAHIKLPSALRPEFALFNEAPSRILISTDQPNAVKKVALDHDVGCVEIGATMKERLRIDHHLATWVDSPVDRLREVWENSLEELLTPAYV